METYIAHICRAEQGIADSVDEYVGITMTEQSERMLNLYATQPQVTP